MTVTVKGKTEIEIETVDEIGHGRTVVAVVVVGATTCQLAVVSQVISEDTDIMQLLTKLIHFCLVCEKNQLLA